MGRARVYRLPGPNERVGQYRVVGPLGRGGQGHVFLAEWEGRSYVLKFIRSLPVSHSGELELNISCQPFTSSTFLPTQRLDVRARASVYSRKQPAPAPTVGRRGAACAPV